MKSHPLREPVMSLHGPSQATSRKGCLVLTFIAEPMISEYAVGHAAPGNHAAWRMSSFRAWKLVSLMTGM